MTGSVRRVPLTFESDGEYLEVKDPCPVFDGRTWHLFGTGVKADRFELLHATARRLAGPWTLRRPITFDDLEGGCLAAPGGVADGGAIHLFAQTEYNRFGGCVEHLVSEDGGETFAWRGTALTAVPGTAEAGMYDPHPAEVGGERYLVYSAFSVVGEPDLHLVRSVSGTWDGPWERLGAILRHEQVGFHNQRGGAGYEWGLEGGQLVELPDGSVLLNAVCFLAHAEPGGRQRVFFALAPDVMGPYHAVGPALTPATAAGGENGHATALVHRRRLEVFFQERDGAGGRWRYARARLPLPKAA